jgi:two-component system, chemotaxis family, sensor kinase Cph1
MGWLQWILDASGFQVPTACGGWTAALVKVSELSNFTIFLCYMAIPFILLTVVGGFFKDRRYAFWFSAFIMLCGLTHLMRTMMFFWPAYRLTVLVQFVTAVVSVLVVFVMIGSRRDASDHREQQAALNLIQQILHRLQWREEEVNRVLAALTGRPRNMEHTPASDLEELQGERRAPPQ